MFRRGLMYSLSLAMGYVPAAVTFGVVSTLLGFSKAETFLMSSLIFAGSSQFALISLLSSSHLNAIIIPLLMNLRHIIYSCITSQRINVSKPFITAFGLTDEVFATSLNAPKSETFLWGLELGAYLAWTLGTLLGLIGGGAILANESLTNSLIFSLTLLFFVLLIPKLKSRHLICALLGAGIAVWFNLMGNPSTGLVLAGVISPLVMMYVDGGKKEGEEA